MANWKKRIVIMGAVGAVALVGYTQLQRFFGEKPKYDVVRQVGDLEIRKYQPRIVARVQLSKGETTSDGFRILAGYIFGGNTTGKSIPMTAPVETRGDKRDEIPGPGNSESKGKRIAMTAPVETQANGEGMMMQFVMPSEYSLADLPTPNDPRVKISKVPAEVVAAHRFSGKLEQTAFKERKQQALNLANSAKLEITGEARVAQYDSPWVLGWFRRNEILMPLAK